MHGNTILPILGVLVLAGCSGSGSSAEGGGPLVPGRWEATVTTDKLEVPGLDPVTMGVVTKQQGGVHKIFVCLKPELVSQPLPWFFEPLITGCRYEQPPALADGKIAARLLCPADAKATLAGTFGGENLEVKADYQGSHFGPQPGGGLRTYQKTVAMTVVSHRVGECDGTEAFSPRIRSGPAAK